mmetsp:Transcript_25669/g.55211  ORF Transcript_25669/g.55211 Transcript_25669/m.55211 type:complete len:347 (-) Transcript_25669:665-1705(-)
MFHESKAVILAQLLNKRRDKVGIYQLSHRGKDAIIVGVPIIKGLSSNPLQWVVHHVQHGVETVNQYPLNHKPHRNTNTESHGKEFHHGIKAQITPVENTKHNHQHQKALSECGNQHQRITPIKPPHGMQQHGHNHKRRNQNKPQQYIPTQMTQRLIMLHPRPIRMLHKPPPHIIHILGILHKRLVRNQINPQHARRQQQSRLPRLLGQSADGEQLTPAFAERAAAAAEEGGGGASHEVASAAGAAGGCGGSGGGNGGVVFVVIIVHIICGLGIDGVASEEGVGTGSVVLVFAFVKVFHDRVVGCGERAGGASFGEEAGVVEVIVLSARAEDGKACAHSTTTANDSE